MTHGDAKKYRMRAQLERLVWSLRRKFKALAAMSRALRASAVSGRPGAAYCDWTYRVSETDYQVALVFLIVAVAIWVLTFLSIKMK